MAHFHCNISGTGVYQSATQDTNNILAVPELERFVAHVGSPCKGNELLEWLAASQPVNDLRIFFVSPPPS